MQSTNGATQVPDDVLDETRLAKLASFGILDTAPEEEFDSIVELATQLCACPVALVSLVDRDRQWFKARIDFPPFETDLDGSVCAHALRSPGVLVIPDLAADPRTARNPLVTGDPFIRFYAGAPLRTGDGQTLGSLCVIDKEPRPGGLTPSQLKGLTALAGQVMAQLELRLAVIGQRDALHRHEVLIRTQRTITRSQGDLDAVLDALVTGAMEVVPAAEGGVMEMRDGDELVYRSARGTLARHVGLRLPLRGSLAGSCLLAGETALCADVRTDRRVKSDMVERLELRSCAVVPVFREAAAVGVLKLQSSRASAFTTGDVEIVEVFAGAVTAGLADHALRRQSKVLQTVTDHVARALFLTDADGRVTFTNPDAERMFGFTAGELAGRNLHEMLHHTQPDGNPYPIDACPLARSLEHGEGVRDREDLFFRKDGTAVNVQVTSAPVIVGGEVVSAVLTVSDITARKAEAGRQADSERLRAATLALGDRLRDAMEVAEVTPLLAAILDGLFDLSHVGFGLVNHEAESVEVVNGWSAEGLASLDGTHLFRDYGSYVEELKRGETVVIEDAATDSRTMAVAAGLTAIDAPAIVNIPLIERGRFVSLLYVACPKPRAWTEEEVIFLRNAADRARAAVARLEAEAHQHVLNEELSHRMKNTMALVQAIAIQTFRSSDDKAAVRAFTDRIHSLASAHNVLLQERWASANIGGVVKAVLNNFGHGERFDTSGPEVKLGPRAVLSLSLLLHELATNAVKYGSLSVESGHVLVSWRLKPSEIGDELVFSWRETGGPPAREPERKGFGSRLMQMGLTGSGGVELIYGPTGLKAEIRASLVDAQAA